MSRKSEYSSTKSEVSSFIKVNSKPTIRTKSYLQAASSRVVNVTPICLEPKANTIRHHSQASLVRKTYSIIIFSAFICSGFFSPRIGDVTFIVGDGVAMEVGVARFIGIDIDEEMGMDEVAERSASWWCYEIGNDLISRSLFETF